MSAPKIDRTGFRRAHNRKLAIALAEAGITIFPSSGKVPLIPGWQRLDVETTPEQRAASIKDYIEKHEKEPAHVGCTKDAATVRKLWDVYPDAVPSISTGPCGLLVLDADTKKNGPELLDGFYQSNACAPTSTPITTTQSGGKHVYYRNTVDHGSSAGAFLDLGVDVRGHGGQVVAPGAIREDGKIYKAATNTPHLIHVFTDDLLPGPPQAVLNALKSSPKNKTGVTDVTVADRIQELEENDWPDTEEAIAQFVTPLIDKDPELKTIWQEPGDDRSTNRFTVARCLSREYGDKMSLLDFAAVLDGYDGAGEFVDGAAAQGEYNLRSIARDWMRGANDHKLVTGEAFAQVPADEMDAAPPPEYLEAKAKKAEEKAKKQKLANLELKSFAAFAAEYKPLQYIIRGILVGGNVYACTARSGHGKTTVLSLLAIAKATGNSDLIGEECREGKIAYFTFENPDDFRMKIMATAFKHGADMALLAKNLFVVDARLSPADMLRIMRKPNPGGEFDLVIVDTFQAGFDGEDFNDNKAVLDYVLRLRSLTRAPGAPAVLIAAHPIKNAERDNLLPYGGGAILNEIDGNLTLWKDDRAGTTTLHHTKLRGPEFAPIEFKILSVRDDRIVDDRGEPVHLPVAQLVTAEMAEQQEREGRSIAVQIMQAMAEEPGAGMRGWARMTGLHPEKVRRELEKLHKERLVTKALDKWAVTPKGRQAASQSAESCDKTTAFQAVTEEDENGA